MIFSGECPSNIALIKYMGKSNESQNKATNSSLSWTLDHLTTKVTIEPISEESDRWELLPTDFPFEMSVVGRNKYLAHVQRMKDHFAIKENFVIRSGNNFPADCGIASSASSFAALTEACCEAFSQMSGKTMSVLQRAQFSSLGSGSSCRSFFSGWVRWDGQVIESMDLALNNLQHMVVIVGGGTKKVSSSNAHKMVKTSGLFAGRVKRAEQRLQQFIVNSQNGDWAQLFQLAWQEFWDMHALFETSHPSFGYFLPDSMQVLNYAREFWQQQGDGPLVTMDAGPNIHLLWREDQKNMAMTFFDQYLEKRWTCLSNIKEIGFAKV